MTFDFTNPKENMARSSKWAKMDALLGGPAPKDALGLWVAQMDFQPGPFLQRTLASLQSEGEYGYFTGLDRFQESISWWYHTRFGWQPDPAHILPTHGIGNAIGLSLQALTEPGDGIIIFTPVYHEFTNKINRNGRTVVQAPIAKDDAGLFQMDLQALEANLTGREKMVIISSPHNPAGRIWSETELRDLAALCLRNDLLLISDEIHMDLAFPGQPAHLPTAAAAPELIPNLIVMSAASKTFDIAGLRTGYVIIPDDSLRARFTRLHHALDIQPNRLGLDLTIAAYSPEGAAWVDELVAVLAENAKALEETTRNIPGLSFAPMQSTYLSWIDASGTGLSDAEINARLIEHGLVTSPGPAFGTGGQSCFRINIGTPRSTLDKAMARLKSAFADLQ